MEAAAVTAEAARRRRNGGGGNGGGGGGGGNGGAVTAEAAGGNGEWSTGCSGAADARSRAASDPGAPDYPHGGHGQTQRGRLRLRRPLLAGTGFSGNWF